LHSEGELLVIDSGEDRPRELILVDLTMQEQRGFRDGTVALCLGELTTKKPGLERKLKVLIDGWIGWAYETELRPLHENRCSTGGVQPSST
jgi:hypothetical protein